MEIEEGKKYLTREGHTVEITLRDNNDLFVCGTIGNTNLTWGIGGQYDPTGVEHPFDIVAKLKIDF